MKTKKLTRVRRLEKNFDFLQAQIAGITKGISNISRELTIHDNDLGSLVRKVGDLSDKVEAEQKFCGGPDTRDAPNGTIAEQPAITFHDFPFNGPIYVTESQAIYMSRDGDCWILGSSDDGWLFIGNGGFDPHAEGNGVWVDASGNEHHGPHGA